MRLVRWLPILLPATLSLAIHANSLPGDFVFDDAHLIRDDARLRAFDPSRVFLENYWGSSRVDLQWRPVVLSTYALNGLVGESATGYHVVNWLLEACVVAVAALVLIRLLDAAWLGCLGAALWATLAIRTEAIANIVGRAELLAALVVLSILAWTLSQSFRDTLGRALLGAAVLLLGLASKESAAVVVPIVFLGARLRRRPIPWRLLGALSASVLVYLALSFAVTRDNRQLVEEGRASLASTVDNPLIEHDRLTSACNGLANLGLYAQKIVAPVNLSADHSYRQIPARALDEDELWLRLVPVALVLLLALLVFFGKWRTSWAFALCFFFAAFAVTGNVLFPIGTVFGERLAYLPSLAWPLFLTSLALPAWKSERVNRAQGVRVVIAFVLLAYGAWQASVAVARDRLWQDAAQLYIETAESSPNSVRAWMMAASGEVLLSRLAGTTEEQFAHLESARSAALRALAIDSENGRATGRLAEVWFEIGTLQLAVGAGESAQTAFRRVVDGFRRARQQLSERKQSEPRYLYYSAESLTHLGKYAAAAKAFDDYAQMSEKLRQPLAPEHVHKGALALLLEAQTLFARGEFARVEQTLRATETALDAAEERKAPAWRVANLRGVARALGADLHKLAGDLDTYRAHLELARDLLDRSIAAAPREPEPRQNRGFCRLLLEDLEGAIADYEVGLAICAEAGPRYHPSQPSVWGFHRKLAPLLLRTGRRADAARHQRRAEAIAQGLPSSQPTETAE